MIKLKNYLVILISILFFINIFIIINQNVNSIDTVGRIKFYSRDNSYSIQPQLEVTYDNGASIVTDTFYPTKDTFFNMSIPNRDTIYCNEDYFSVSYVGTSRSENSVIQFDVSSIPDNSVVSATLSLVVKSVVGTVDVEVTQVGVYGAWTECWSYNDALANNVGPNTEPNIIQTVNAADIGNRISWDVTQHVDEWLRDPYYKPNHGFFISAVNFAGGGSNPIADFNWNPLNPSIDELISFDASLSSDDGSIVQYDWKWYGTDIWHYDIGPNPTHSYDTVGTYSVSLRVIDNDANEDIITKSVSVLPPTALTANANADPLWGYTGDSINFYGSASGGTPPYTYQWSFGDGEVSILQNPTHIYSISNAIYVTLEVTDSGSPAQTDETFIWIDIYESDVPTVETKDASDIGIDNANLNLEIDSLGYYNCRIWFEYGLTDTYGDSTTPQPISSVGDYQQQIQNLQQNTNYHFRAVAENDFGISYGDDNVFRTNNPPTLELIEFSSDWAYCWDKIVVKYTDFNNDEPDLIEISFNNNWHTMESDWYENPQGIIESSHWANDNDYTNGQVYTFKLGSHIPVDQNGVIGFTIRCYDTYGAYAVTTGSIDCEFSGFDFSKDSYSFTNNPAYFPDDLVTKALLGNGACYGMSKTAWEYYFERKNGDLLFDTYACTKDLPSPKDSREVCDMIVLRDSDAPILLLEELRIYLFSAGPVKELNVIRNRLSEGSPSVVIIDRHAFVVYGVLKHDTDNDGTTDAASLIIYDPNYPNEIRNGFVDLDTNEFWYYFNKDSNQIKRTFVVATEDVLSEMADWFGSLVTDTGDDFIKVADDFLTASIDELGNAYNNVISTKLMCPAELHIFDNNFNHTGLNDEKIPEADIPFSTFSRIDNDTISIILNSTGNYIFEVAGTDTGLYNLTIYKNESKSSKSFHAMNISIYNKTRHIFFINWDEINESNAVKILIDYDGDGDYDGLVYSDNILTQDDLIKFTKISKQVPIINQFGFIFMIMSFCIISFYEIKRKKEG